MNFLTQFFELIGKLVRWWVIVEPWEQAIRVRLGKHTKLLYPGIHFRIPFVDTIYVQNVRMRALCTASQTINTIDDYLVTISGTLRYRIADVLKLQTTLHDAQATVLNMINAQIADCVATRSRGELSPTVINKWVNERLNLEQFGLGDAQFTVQDYAAPRRVIRLIQDSLGLNHYQSNGLTTNCNSDKTPPAGSNGLVR